MLQLLKSLARRAFPRPEQALLKRLYRNRLSNSFCDLKLPNGRLIQGLKPLEAYNEYKDIFMKGIYDAKLSSPSPKIIDAGAYIGLSTIYFLQRYPNCDLTLFECDPEIIKKLKCNVPEIERGEVKLEPFALAADHHQAIFYRSGDDAGSMVQQHGDGFPVECRPLSDYLETKIDLLKMNIEGAEMDVLAACGKKLRQVKEMIIEFHSFTGHPQRLDELLKTLRDQGFRYCINHFDEESNWACRTPFRVTADTSFILLVHAIQEPL
jgi:FkbM family methyltransferase